MRYPLQPAVVVPTCRPERISAFVQAWRNFRTGDVVPDLYLIVDRPPTDYDRDQLPEHAVVFDWADTAEFFADDQHIFSRRDSACRSIGFYLAWLEGCDFIVTIDDDCLPVEGQEDLVRGHCEAMAAAQFQHPWHSTVDGLRLRGLPYIDAPWTGRPAQLNVGLWNQVHDFDAVTQLGGQLEQRDLREVPPRKIPRDRLVPMCGMNLAFTDNLAPLMYFGLQGLQQPVGRFDDIWCGVIAKVICDHLGIAWSYGPPIVCHSRASDPLANLMREAPGVAEHEYLWRHLMDMPLRGSSPVECMGEAAEHVGRYEPRYLPPLYFRHLSEAMAQWTQLFDPSCSSGCRLAEATGSQDASSSAAS